MPIDPLTFMILAAQAAAQSGGQGGTGKKKKDGGGFGDFLGGPIGSAISGGLGGIASAIGGGGDDKVGKRRVEALKTQVTNEGFRHSGDIATRLIQLLLEQRNANRGF